MYQQFAQKECDECKAVKHVREAEPIAVEIEPGMRDGQEIKFYEQGEAEIDGDFGDLTLIVKQLPDARFVRVKDDLRYNASISLLDALVGFSSTLVHLDGHKV